MAILLAGCGSDGADDTAASSSSNARSGSTGLDDYCDRVAEYLDTTESIDTSRAEAVVNGLSRAAEKARAAAAAAPREVRDAHEKLASAAEALTEELRSRAPRTMEELENANAEITPRLQAEYGDLEAETTRVEAFGAAECGLSFDD